MTLDFAPFLTSGFLLRALVAGALIGFVAANLGVFVVLRKMAFFSDAIAHASLTGIAFGLLIGVQPLLGAVVFSVLIALGITYFSRHSTVAVDTIIGVFYSAAISLGIILIGFLPGYRADLFGYLFGDILAVSSGDLLLLGVLALATIVAVFAFYRPWLKIAFDRDLAAIEGVPVAMHDYLYLSALALVVALGIKLVGVILIGPLIIIPAAAAKNVSTNIRSMFIWATAISLFSTVFGLMAAYALNVAAGPAIVLTATGCFAVSFLFRR